VLVTGGAGFLGLRLTKHLIRHGYKVDLVDNYSRGVRDQEFIEVVANDGVRFHQADLLDLDNLAKLDEQYEYIFHLAAIIGVTHVLERPYQVLTDNVRMVFNLIDLCRRQNKLKRFFFASTSEVYAGTLRHFDLPIPSPERTPLAVTDLSSERTSYMLSKIYGEALCHQSDIPFTVFRPHNIYGPRMGLSHVIPEQLQKAFRANEGDAVEVFSADHRRCFCHVDDAVELLRLMMESQDCAGETLNLGQEAEEVTIEQAVKTCWDVVGKDLVMEKMPETQGSPKRRVPDMSKTISLTGYSPTIAFREGVERTFDWYCRHVFSGQDISAN
jgi:UDP-glucose 4-epimerase